MSQPTVVVGADTAQAVRALQDVAKAAALTKDTTDVLNESLKHVAETNKLLYDGQSRTLGLYKQLIGVTTSLNALYDKESHAIAAVAATTKVFAEAMGTLDIGLKNVKKTSEEAYAGQARTLDLYSRMLGITKQAADIKLKEAAATEKQTKAQAGNITATMKQEAADRKAAEAAAAKAAAQSKSGTSLPMSPNVTGQWAAGADKNATSMIAAQDKLGAALARQQQATIGLETALGRTDSLAERSARNRLTLAEAEVSRQEEILRIMIAQYEAEKLVADEMTKRVTAPGGAADVGAVNAAAAAQARAAATGQEATRAATQLTAAKQAQLRAEKELQALQDQSIKRTVTLAATQDKYTASVMQSDAAFRGLNVAIAKYESVAEKDAEQRLVMATEEREKQEQILAVLIEQARVSREIAVQQRAKLSSATGASIEDIAGASAAEARSATDMRNATTAARQLTAAQLEEERAARAVAAAHEDAGSKADESGKKLGGTRYALYQVAAAYGVVAAAGFLFSKGTITVAASYEQAFAQVQRTTGQTSLALVPLHDALLELSTTIPKSFEDLSAIAQMGAQMGIPAGDLDNFTKVIAEFSATTNVATSQAAMDFGKLSNLLDVPTSQFENLASAVSYLGVTSVATETQILNVSQSIAATGHTVGLSTEEVLGLSAAFASLAVSPEQARSAMARLFLNLDKAVSNNGKELQVWASLLGTSVDQVKFLRATNPDELFNSIISAFHNVQQSGGDLTGVFTDLGLKSIRDIQVFERLANGFDVVTNSLQNAGKAFADGTYLSESFAIVNETVAAKAQKVADAFRNMLAGIGGNSVVQNVIKGILDGILNLLEAFNKLPTGVRTALGTFISLLGVFAAYKASMALLTAGLLAFRQAQGGGINAATVGFRTLLREANLAFGGAAKAAAAYAAASTAAGKAAASSAGGIAAQTAALGANAAAGTAATVSKGAGAAGTVAKGAGSVASVAGAAGGVLAGITKSFGPVLVISSVISLVAGLVSAFHQQDQAAVSAAENLQKYGASLLEAGGGAQSLIDAMNKDQASFEKVGGSTQKLDGYFGKVVEHFGAIENGVSKVTRTFYDMNGVATDLGSRFVATGKAQDDYASSQKGVQSSVKNTNKTLQDQVTILGANSEKWLQNAISNELTADNSPLKPQDLSNLLTAFGASGLTLGQAIADGVTQGAGKLASDVAPILDGLKQQIEINTGEIRAKYSVMLNPDLHPDLTLQDRTAAEAKMAAETDAANKPLNDQIAAIQVLTDMINGGTSALGGLADKQTLLNQIAAAFPPIADDMSGSGADVTNTFDDLNTKVQTTTQQMQAAASAFTAMLGLLTDTADASLAVSDSMAALGKSIADNGTEFDQYTEGGRKNLHALLDVVGAVGKQLAGEVANGQITAEQAAEAMQTYMTNLTQQLGQIGVPTDQITFLVNYLSSVVSTKWGINIGADISAAMTGINTVAVAAQQAQAYINGLGTTYANMADVDKAGRLSAGGYAGLAGQVQSAAPVYSGPTSFYGSNAGVLDAAKAQEDAANASKAASAATKDASKSAKDAATTAKDAAQAAKDAADAQTRYLQAAGAYFASFAKDSLTMVDSIGNTVEALQKLGQAIAENGTAFNVVTEGGRANWTALEAVFTDFGNTLQTEVTNGTLSAADALAQYQQMAGGVYSELIALGVPAADIDAWFKSMGMDTTGWDNANAAVAAYAGFITAAYDATGEFMKQTDKTADYVQRLTDALNTQATAYWGLQDAQDGVATQFNQMKKAQDDNATSIADLIAKNKELNATIGDQTVIANKAYANYLLAKKYGETGRAADYLQQYNDAKGQITTAQGQVKTNTAQVATLKASKNLLTGNSQAAIDNRKSLQDLTNTYTTQIEAYAAAGHTQAEVAAYAKTLKEQFDAQATSLGYTRDQLKPYNTELDNIVTTIGKIPATVSTTVSADTTAASAALGAIPTSGSYKISTLVDAATVTTTKQTLKNIPNKADYKVTASANTVPATTALGKIPKTGGYAITPTVSALTATQKANLAAGLPKNFNLEAVLKIRDAQVDTMWSTLQTQLNKKANQTPLYITGTLVAGPGGTGHIYTGGQVAAVPMTRGYAEGGLLPGTPPANPTVDNLMATGPQGIYHLRSREFIQSQPAVDYYGVGVMNALNQRMIPRNRFMASGGSVGGGGGGGVGWDGPVELSMADRQLLRQIRDAQPNVYVGDSAVAHSSARGAETNSRRGGY